MNDFRRVMLTLSCGATFVVGLSLGRGDPGWIEVLLVGLALMGATYWSLTNWDAVEKADAATQERLAKIAAPLRERTEQTVVGEGKIAAIKLIRAELGLGLKEAKELVEALDADLRLRSGS